ncbi:MAG: hypothetical protein ACK42H_07090 [Planctomycetota bacterium]|jgi:hypothetical protein
MKKCKCPPGSPFHWRQDPRPSIFVKDNAALLSMRQTEVVESARRQGRDIGHIPGVTTKIRYFHFFSKA